MIIEEARRSASRFLILRPAPVLPAMWALPVSIRLQIYEPRTIRTKNKRGT